jgi:hypothetical protein
METSAYLKISFDAVNVCGLINRFEVSDKMMQTNIYKGGYAGKCGVWIRSRDRAVSMRGG